MRTNGSGLGLVLAALACAPSRPALEAPEALARRTRDLASLGDAPLLFGRELRELPPAAPVRGRGWQANVRGRSPHVTPLDDGTEKLVVPIGTGSNIVCIVFPEPVDAATTVARTLENVRDPLELTAIRPLAVVVEQESPLFFLAADYVVDTPEGELAGQLKLGLVGRARPLLCLHDEPGYSKSFERVVRGLAASLDVLAERRPTAISIGVVRLGELPVGFAQSWREQLPDGEHVSASLTARVIPRSPTELVARDEASRVVVAEGRVRRGVWVAAGPLGAHHRIELEAKAGGYTVSGTAKGQPISGELAAKGGIPSGSATARRVARELASGKPFRFTQKEYDPSLDPLRLVDVSYWHDASDLARVVHSGVDAIRVTAVVDDAGYPTHVEVAFDGTELTIDQIYERDDG